MRIRTGETPVPLLIPDNGDLICSNQVFYYYRNTLLPSLLPYIIINEHTEQSQPSRPARRALRERRGRGWVRLPRTLLLWWSMWLLAAWVLSFGWDSPLRPNLREYESSVGRLLVLLAIGLAVVWPLFRLSAFNRGAPRIIAFVDFVAMVFTLQVVLWPMRISGMWSFTRLIALDWMLCAWSLIIAACIAMGTVDSPSRRQSAHQVRNYLRINIRRGLWMSIALLLSLVGPFVAITLHPESPEALEIFQWSPIASAWWMSSHTLGSPDFTEWLRLSIITTVGVIAWTGLLLQAKAQKGEQTRL